MGSLVIRPSTPEDRSLIVSCNDRLADVASFDWRTGDDIRSYQAAFTKEALSNPEATGYIAEDSVTGAALGFAYVEAQPDPITQAPSGYVSLLAVKTEAEGRGVASALMAAVEELARRKGWRFLSLETFTSNDRGRAFYQRQGYAEETLRLVKPIAVE